MAPYTGMTSRDMFMYTLACMFRMRSWCVHAALKQDRLKAKEKLIVTHDNNALPFKWKDSWQFVLLLPALESSPKVHVVKRVASWSWRACQEHPGGARIPPSLAGV